MKKLSRKAGILLGVGILVVFGASLGMLHSQETEEQSWLSQELDVIQLRLKKHSPDEFSFQQRELEWRLAQTEVQVNAAKDRLRQSVDSIEVTETLFEVAADNGVEMVEISSPGLSSEDLDSGVYSILLLAVVVEGNVSSLVDFILEVGRKFPTSVIETAEITVPAVVGGESRQPSATVSLRIYSYQDE
ncbi:MAG: hypothetical protein JSU76_02655 [Dehalococcoidia bacterium]|nr:MAG: hypothetical protein JSU76_02655 [Dehalococcoidia bacterium]